jgi:integrase
VPRVATKLSPNRSGGFFARKRIPADVREEYRRLYGNGWEERFVSEPGRPAAAVKQQWHDWLAEIESRIANIRAARNGDGRTLTRAQARALAGEWYHWFVDQHSSRPHSSEHWDYVRDEVQSVLREFAASSERQHDDLNLVWDHNEDARAAVRPMLADWGETSRFLAARRLTLTSEARDLFLDNLYSDLAAALRRLDAIAAGDYSPDKYAERFPRFEGVDGGLSAWDLFEKWIAALKPAKSTVDRWRAVFMDLKVRFPERTASSITEEEASEWARGLVTPERSPRTVSDVWLVAARTVFAWGVTQKFIRRNPFTDVVVAVPKKPKLREGKWFTPEEAQTILKAALAIRATHTAADAARRWVPWLCAYSGARVGEITQLRGVDVIEREGIHALRLTPEAGTIKGRGTRVVPLHEHLVAQGFLEFVKSKGKGPLFYNPSTPLQDEDPTNPRRPRAIKARERLAAWVRKLGITDPELQPNHAWRHTFKLLAERHGISERMHDQITDHAAKNVSRQYGKATLEDMAAALEKYPRYRLE